MNQSEALSLAIEMLERVAPGVNYDANEFYEQLRDIKATILPGGPKAVDPGSAGTGARPDAAAEASSARDFWPRTVIVCGEEFYEIDRQTIEGRNLILMESCRDGGEAPAVIVDADTHEVVIDEADNGFQDYRDERAVVR
jgi:hypothetical protein